MSQVCSIFSQLLKLFPRAEFEQAVRQHRGERHARGFTCWGQFVAMLFCQLGRAQSLREICGGLAASQGNLGLSGSAASTLALADLVFQQLLASAAARRRHKLPLLSLATPASTACEPRCSIGPSSGAGQAASGARPRRLFAQLLRRHRRQDARAVDPRHNFVAIDLRNASCAATERQRWQQRTGVFDQSPGAGGCDDRRHLSRPLADRTVFQGPQAEPASEDLRGHLGEGLLTDVKRNKTYAHQYRCERSLKQQNTIS